MENPSVTTTERVALTSKLFYFILFGQTDEENPSLLSPVQLYMFSIAALAAIGFSPARSGKQPWMLRYVSGCALQRKGFFEESLENKALRLTALD